jgi:hypothetical protein
LPGVERVVPLGLSEVPEDENASIELRGQVGEPTKGWPDFGRLLGPNPRRKERDDRVDRDEVRADLTDRIPEDLLPNPVKARERPTVKDVDLVQIRPKGLQPRHDRRVDLVLQIADQGRSGIAGSTYGSGEWPPG